MYISVLDMHSLYHVSLQITMSHRHEEFREYIIYMYIYVIYMFSFMFMSLG